MKPVQLVVELRTGIGIAIRKIKAANHSAVHDGFIELALLILRLAKPASRSCPGRWCRSRLMAVLSDIEPEDISVPRRAN
jgi:hypothetical protein